MPAPVARTECCFVSLLSQWDSADLVASSCLRHPVFTWDYAAVPGGPRSLKEAQRPQDCGLEQHHAQIPLSLPLAHQCSIQRGV